MLVDQSESLGLVNIGAREPTALVLDPGPGNPEIA